MIYLAASMTQFFVYWAVVGSASVIIFQIYERPLDGHRHWGGGSNWSHIAIGTQPTDQVWPLQLHY